MQVTGTIKHLTIETVGVSKAGKAWRKREFVIETDEQYPKLIFIQVMGDGLCGQLSYYKPGFKITANVNILSREHNGNWYTTVSAWKLEGHASNGQQNDSFYADPETSTDPELPSDDLPF